MQINERIKKLREDCIENDELYKKRLSPYYIKENNITEVWACAYEVGDTGKKVLNCKPSLLAVRENRFGDMILVEYKKNSKETKSINSGVQIYSRMVFTNRNDCINMYNKLVKFEYKKAMLKIEEIRKDYIQI